VGGDDRQIVRTELERLLANPFFGIVGDILLSCVTWPNERWPEKTLFQKERSNRRRVFDRAPDYDASDDHIVRTANV